MTTFDDRSLVEIRRDLHRHPEEGWKEFRRPRSSPRNWTDSGSTSLSARTR
nr:hypothetical protein [Halogeometricum sp. CBA1124]